MATRIILLISSLLLVFYGLKNLEMKPPTIEESKEEVEIEEDLIKTQMIRLEKSYSREDNFIRKNEGIIHLTFDENTVQFDLGSYKLDDQARRQLNPLIDVIDPKNKITISGHTCNIGSDEHNFTLSKRRAESVMGYIQYKKPSIRNIEILGYGELYPKMNNHSESNRRLNRRVELKLEEAKKPSREEEPNTYPSTPQGAFSPGAPKGEGSPKSSGGDASKDEDSTKEDKPRTWNSYFEEFNWAILLIGVFASIFSIVDILRKWNN